MSFANLLDDYSRRNPLCNKLGHKYVSSTDVFSDCFCMKWNCSFCRPILKYIYYVEILKMIYAFNMDKHFVITFGGKDQRKKYSFQESYKIMNKRWHSFLVCLRRKYSDLNYILLCRSHKDGYCHYHIIIDCYISWSWLNKVRKNYGLGFVSIQRNKSVSDYLCTDFWRDNEWCIPSAFKHIRTSRNIKLCNFENGFDIKFFPNTVSLKDAEFYIKCQYNPDFDIWFYHYKNFVNDNLIK